MLNNRNLNLITIIFVLALLGVSSLFFTGCDNLSGKGYKENLEKKDIEVYIPFGQNKDKAINDMAEVINIFSDKKLEIKTIEKEIRQAMGSKLNVKCGDCGYGGKYGFCLFGGCITIGSHGLTWKKEF